MADVSTGDTQITQTKMEFITAIVQRELAAAAKVRPTITDVSQFAEKGNDKISFPKFGSFTVTKKVSGTPVDAASLADSKDTLDLDQQAVVQWLIEKKASIQTRVNLEAEYAARAGSAHGRQVDTDILSALSTDANAGNDVTFAANLTKDNILEMRENLDDTFTPEDGRVLVVSPARERDMLNIQEFIDASRYGSREPIFSGQIGQVYGIPVIKSQLLPGGTEAMMYHREALAIGFQIDPMFLEDDDLPNLATRYSLDQLYGVKVLQGGDLISVLR